LLKCNVVYVYFSEGSGSFYGTLGGAIHDLDPTKPKYRQHEKPTKEKPNFKTNPSKKGTGYGYVFIFQLIQTFFLFCLSYANLGFDKDPPYAYRDRTDNYDGPLNAQRVQIIILSFHRKCFLIFFRKIFQCINPL
jgi:hypothetical protein